MKCLSLTINQLIFAYFFKKPILKAAKVYV